MTASPGPITSTEPGVGASSQAASRGPTLARTREVLLPEGKERPKARYPLPPPFQPLPQPTASFLPSATPEPNRAACTVRGNSHSKISNGRSGCCTPVSPWSDITGPRSPPLPWLSVRQPPSHSHPKAAALPLLALTPHAPPSDLPDGYVRSEAVHISPAQPRGCWGLSRTIVGNSKSLRPKKFIFENRHYRRNMAAARRFLISSIRTGPWRGMSIVSHDR